MRFTLFDIHFHDVACITNGPERMRLTLFDIYFSVARITNECDGLYLQFIFQSRVARTNAINSIWHVFSSRIKHERMRLTLFDMSFIVAMM